jgi:carbamoyl-phosphate synthase small subunit
MIVKQLCDHHSNWRATGALDTFLAQHGVPGIAGVDTRKLTRLIRAHGVMMGAISGEDLPTETLLQRITAEPDYGTIDYMKEVTAGQIYPWYDAVQEPYQAMQRFRADPPLKVTVVDYGVKRNILRLLTTRGCQVRVVPCDATPEMILEGNPDGIAFSPGPGDPANLDYAIRAMEGVVTSGIPILFESSGQGSDTQWRRAYHRAKSRLCGGCREYARQRHDYLAY